MTDISPHPRLEELLEHADWIHALARTLVRDPATADDLVQDTWSAAIEHPSSIPTTGPTKPWLATVLKNLWRSRLRGEGRRRAREHSAAAGEALPPESEMLERMERQRALLDRVLELDEPYRSTVILRYYEELPTREIARRQGEPHERIRWRLKRAHALLRERLRDRHGDQWGAWCALLLPHAERAAPGSTPRGPGGAPVLASSKVLGAAAAATLAGLVIWIALPPKAATAEPQRVASAAATPAALPATPNEAAAAMPAAASGSLPGDLARSARLQVASVPGDAEALLDPTPPVGTLTGFVIAADTSVPLPGAQLTLLAKSGPPANQFTVPLGEARSGPDGAFAFGEVPAAPYHLVCRLEGRPPLTLRSIDVPTGGTRAIEVQLLPGNDLEVSVSDPDGRPVQAAEVIAITGSAKSISIFRDASTTGYRSWSGETGGDGVAQLAGIGTGANQVVVKAEGFANWTSELSVIAGSNRISARLTPGAVLRGRVHRTDGVPLERTYVFVNPCEYDAPLPAFQLEQNGVACAPDGSFEIHRLPPGTYYALALAKDGACGFLFGPQGSGPSRELGTVRLEAGEQSWLELPVPHPARLAGRVVDPDGTPIEGARAYLSWGDMKPSSTGFFQLYRVPTSKEWTHQTTHSDSAGRFEIDPVRISYEPLELNVDAEGYVGVRLELGAESGESLERELVLEPIAEALSGRLSSAGNGSGVEGVTVGAWAYVDDRRDGLYLGDSQADGSYTIAVPSSPERFEVYPILRDHDAWVAAPSERQVWPRRDGAADGIDFVLSAKSVLTGDIVDTAGAPVPGYLISLAEDRDREARPALDYDLGGGEFHIPLTSKGLHIYFTAPGFETEQLDMGAANAPDPAERLRVVMRPAGELRGRVLAPDGSGLAGALVAMATLDGLAYPALSSHAPSAVTDPDGRFYLAGAPAVAGTQLLVAPERVDLPPLVRYPLDGSDPERITIQLEATVEVICATSAAGLLVIDAAGWPIHPEIESTLTSLRAQRASAGEPPPPAFGEARDGEVRFWLSPGTYHFLRGVEGTPELLGSVTVEPDRDSVRIQLP